MLSDTDFICGLMRQNTDALGFIPRPTVRDRFVPRGQYLIQLNRFRKPIGYLIHGPLHPDGSVYIHQAVIDLHRRNRHFGNQMVNQLVARATRNSAGLLRLRCASDLDAVAFWTALGFQPKETTPGGHRRRRDVIRFELPLNGASVFQPRKVGLQLASGELPPEGLAASQSSSTGETVKEAARAASAERASGGSWSVSGQGRVPRPVQTTVSGFTAHF